jgi:hypothetical protein
MPPDAERLRHFIRTTLGCGCPDEILEWIQCSSSDEGPADDLRLTRMDVGGRLLVYVLEDGTSGTAAAEAIPAVVASGLSERDRGGFNRLRIVIASDDPDAARPRAEALFRATAPEDDRLHLHVVAYDELPFG